LVTGKRHHEPVAGRAASGLHPPQTRRAGPRCRAIAAAVVAWCLIGDGTRLTPAQEQPDLTSATGLQAAAALEQALVAAIARAERSVVAITRYRLPPPGSAPDAGGAPSAGSDVGATDDRVPHEYAAGIVIDARGYILTNYHVLGNPTQNAYTVWIQRKPYQAVDVRLPAEVKAGDPWTDLAILKIDAEGLEPITFANSQQLRKGQIVIALGNPYGIASDGQVSASWGIISNLGRPFPSRSNPLEENPGQQSLYQYGGLIQTDAKLNLGTSGGALVNLQGELVGLITALAAAQGYERSMGFAIPADDVFRRTIETLKTGRKPEFGFLGVSSTDLSHAMLRSGQHGARVTHVAPGTPAASARLKEDDIITQINDTTIYDRDDLMRELGRQPVRGEIQLTVERGGQLGRRGRVIQTSAVLTKRHIAAARAAYAQVPDPRWRGAVVDDATALPQDLLQQAIQGNMPPGSLAAIEVPRDSTAWRSGLREGAVITHVQGRRVTTPAEFLRVVEDHQQAPVRLTLLSGELVVSP
jgi:serine protease Do